MAKLKGLGRGLEALLGSSESKPAAGGETLLPLPLDALQPGRYQPRLNYYVTLTEEEPEAWRGEIRDGEVVRTDEEVRDAEAEEEEELMSVARNTEISVESSKSFDDAIREGIDRATKTLRNVRGAWIKEQALDIEGDRITRYKVTMIVTFVLE